MSYNIPEIRKFPEVDFSSLEKSVARKQRNDNIKFWIPLIISAIALAVSFYSLHLQRKEYSQQKEDLKESKRQP